MNVGGTQPARDRDPGALGDHGPHGSRKGVDMIVGIALALSAGLIAGQLGHAVGTAPILAALLCAACFLRRRDLVLVGTVGILARDLVAGISWFTLVRLAGVLSVVGIVTAIRVRPSMPSLMVGLLVSAPVYHLMLAVGDWVFHVCSQEPWTPAGLTATLASSLPYVQRSFLGDLLFTSAFLGLYTLAGYLVTLRWPSVIPGHEAPHHL